jgi:lactoylglutathione lyase
MKIDHIAMWSDDLDRIKDYYVRHFNAQASGKYRNPQKQYEAVFLSFSSGARLEIMKQPGIKGHDAGAGMLHTGYAHLSFACGSEQGVDELTERIHKDGYQVINGPRHTGDGYYESVVLDPDGNLVEITV